jgi:hypothetical protein
VCGQAQGTLTACDSDSESDSASAPTEL